MFSFVSQTTSPTKSREPSLPHYLSVAKERIYGPEHLRELTWRETERATFGLVARPTDSTILDDDQYAIRNDTHRDTFILVL